MKLNVAVLSFVMFVILCGARGDAYAEPVDFAFHGFDDFQDMSYRYEGVDGAITAEMQQVGLDAIFAGRGFYNGMPVKVFNFIREKKTKQLQSWKFFFYRTFVDFMAKYTVWGARHQFVDPVGQEGQFEIFGRTPSPQSRPEFATLGRLGLTQSAFVRDGQTFLNNNCLSCHSGVAYGPTGPMVVAGLGNNQIDQHALMVEARGIVRLLEDDNFQQEMRVFLATTHQSLTATEEEELQTFIKKVHTTVEPTFRFANTIGFNAGPYGVWTLLARMIDPKLFGFETFDFVRNVRGHIRAGQHDWERFRAVYGAEHSDDEVWQIYNAAYDRFETLRAQAHQIELPPVMPNAWFLRKFRKSWGYWYGDRNAGFDQYAGVHFAQNFTDEHPLVNVHHEEHAHDIATILQFANAIQPPAYPGMLDAELVKRGQGIFHNDLCTHCHGTYEKTAGYEDRYDEPGHWVVNHTFTTLVNVGTDSAYNDVLHLFEQFDKKFAAFGEERVSGLKEFWRRYGDETLAPNFAFPDRAGYVPPPLVGLWAAAPYFHNGSVPELEQVLNSKKRPTVWTRIDLGDEKALRQWDATRRVGVPNMALSDKQVRTQRDLAAQLRRSEPSANYIYTREYLDFRRVYDTAEPGKANGGHTFGDHFTDAERQAVVEFLKSISGPGVAPKSDAAPVAF